MNAVISLLLYFLCFSRVCFYYCAGLYDVFGFDVCLYKPTLFSICQSFTNIKGSVLAYQRHYDLVLWRELISPNAYKTPAGTAVVSEDT